jgi:hypothetical protein
MDIERCFLVIALTCFFVLVGMGVLTANDSEMAADAFPVELLAR